VDGKVRCHTIRNEAVDFVLGSGAGMAALNPQSSMTLTIKGAQDADVLLFDVA